MSESVAMPGGEAGARAGSAPRRGILGAFASAAVATAIGVIATASSATTVDAAPNCMNVLARDLYWGAQYDVYRAVAYAGNLEAAFADADFTIGTVPALGALMVWRRHFAGANWTGHVGIVTAIGDDDTVLVKHENWPQGAGERLSTFDVLPGHRFIHSRPPDPGTMGYPDESRPRP